MCLDVCARNISKSRLIQCIAQNMTKSRRIYALFPGVFDVIHDPHESWKTEMDDLGHTHKSATSNQDNKAWPSSPQLLTGLPHHIKSTSPPLTPISVACRFAVKTWRRQPAGDRNARRMHSLGPRLSWNFPRLSSPGSVGRGGRSISNYRWFIAAPFGMLQEALPKSGGCGIQTASGPLWGPLATSSCSRMLFS